MGVAGKSIEKDGRTRTNGLLFLAPRRPPVSLPGTITEQRRDMEYHDHDQSNADEALVEIASILARGYMRYVKSRSQGLDGNKPSGDVGDGENTAALTEHRLD